MRADPELEFPLHFVLSPVAEYRHQERLVSSLEFTAPEGIVVVPRWMHAVMGLEEGEEVKLRCCRLPSAKYCKLRPHDKMFYTVPDPKELLRGALVRYACLKKGSTIVVDFDGQAMFFDVIDIESTNGPLALGSGASIIDLDLEVDFAPAPDIDPEDFTTASQDQSLPLPNEERLTPGRSVPVTRDVPSPPMVDASPAREPVEDLEPGLVVLLADLEGMGFNGYDARVVVVSSGLTGAPGDLETAIELMLGQ